MRDYFMVSDCDGGLYDTRDPQWSKAAPLRPNYSRHHREIGTVADLKASLRAGAYVFPGAYEIAYLTADGACLCHECTRKEFRQIVGDLLDRDSAYARWNGGTGWEVCATVHSGETDSEVSCDHCGRVIFEGES